ncbi:IQ calmodulin-binding motif protein (macronuclear) [Tetrahymena thermophila SB210]|uniref:IQ calmodulin-binding motif protein n=1 Tax=Tetrahymena thermophila (strain SB210) TaxID=312017 RepID=Q23E21_TETTS|nr:IQ calmodulin-binding motif protein [Tetrahymena thermophila SB210]EAR94766.2 IQ calmodulin-binding motif protein [Tetrahymena thermophila SB210]|eukprot:XP_001015011.2 IQ calmodulin-binding motif protein [Tetrahymena thermophila SB210]
MFQMDFKVRKYIQHAKLHEMEKHKNDGDLDTLEKIDQKFNDFCTVYEKQFDQILSRGSTKADQESKIYSKSHLRLDGGYKRQNSLKKQPSGIILNGSVDNLYAGQSAGNINTNQILLTQKSKTLSKNGSMPQICAPNFIIRKNMNDTMRVSSTKSFSNLDMNDTQMSPLKLNGKTQQNNYVSQNSIQGTIQNQSKNSGTQNGKISRYEHSSQSGFPSYSTQATLNPKQNTDESQKFQRSQSRKNTALESPSKSLAISPRNNSPNKIQSNVTSQKLIQDHQQTKTVKFANESPKIKSLKNIEEIQDNLVKIGIGSLMLEQLRLSQIDLNKIEDVNSFSDRQSLLSSKILKEFGIGQAQVIGFKKEQEKQEYIMKTINNTVTSLYKKWIKSQEERAEKIENMEEEYQDLKDKLNKREKQDFEWMNIDTEYKALENELKQLIVKKLNDYETQTYILDNIQSEKEKQQTTNEMPKMQQPSIASLPNKKNSIDSKEYGGSMSNGLESPPQSPLQVGDSNNKLFKTANTYSIKVISNDQENNGSLNKEQTPRKHSIDFSKNNFAKQQILNYPLSSRGYIQEKNSHLASTVMHTDHSNMTDINTSITKQSGRKGNSIQLDSQHNFRKSFNQSATNLSSYNNNAEESILFSSEKQQGQSSVQKGEKNQLYDYQQNIQREQDAEVTSIPRVTNKEGKKYVYGENTYVKEEILDEKLVNKITEYVDKSDYIKELGEKLYSQIDWKIELDNAFIELRKENRKKNNKISKGNNMNLITFFPIMQDLFKNLKSDRNKEKLMQKYREGEMLTNEQLSFLASTNQLLNRFIDRDYLDKGIKFFQKKGIQSNLEYLLAENIIQTYELIKEIIFFHRKNYLFNKNKQLLQEQDMFKQRQEQKVIDLQKAKEKIKMNKRMEAVCRSLDKKLIEKEMRKIENQNRLSFALASKDKSNNPANHVAQKFVDNIKKSIFEKQSLRDTFINHISIPKQAVKIEEIKQKKKDNQEKQKMLDKISAAEGVDLLQRLTNKAKYEDDPKNEIRRSYHPSSKLFVEEHRDEYNQITPNEKKIVDNEIKRFKRKFIQSKAQDQENHDKNNFASFYTGGPLQSSYINSKYYGEKQIKTIIRVQAIARGYLARKILKALKEKKRREAEIRRKAEKTREKMLLKERIKLELYSPKGIIDKMTPKSKKSQNGSPKVGFSDELQSKKIKKKSRFSKVHRKSILTQAHYDLAMQNEMKLNYHRKVILNQDVSNRFQKLIGAAKSNNFAYIEKGKFQFFTMDVNKCDENKNSPLYYAAFHGNIYFCQYLVELGADVNQVCQEGNTPFHMACQSNNKNLIMLFIQAGGNLDKTNVEGLTPLSYASFDMLQQLDAMKVISLRDTNIKQNFRNLKIFKRGIPESEFKTSAVEYDPSHQFTQFPSQKQQQQAQ